MGVLGRVVGVDGWFVSSLDRDDSGHLPNWQCVTLGTCDGDGWPRVEGIDSRELVEIEHLSLERLRMLIIPELPELLAEPLPLVLASRDG